MPVQIPSQSIQFTSSDLKKHVRDHAQLIDISQDGSITSGALTLLLPPPVSASPITIRDPGGALKPIRYLDIKRINSATINGGDSAVRILTRHGSVTLVPYNGDYLVNAPPSANVHRTGNNLGGSYPYLFTIGRVFLVSGVQSIPADTWTAVEAETVKVGNGQGAIEDTTVTLSPEWDGTTGWNGTANPGILIQDSVSVSVEVQMETLGGPDFLLQAGVAMSWGTYPNTPMTIASTLSPAAGNVSLNGRVSVPAYQTLQLFVRHNAAGAINLRQAVMYIEGIGF
jgi:hypothetical protein